MSNTATIINANSGTYVYSKFDIENMLCNPEEYHSDICRVVEVILSSHGSISNVIYKTANLAKLSYVTIPTNVDDTVFEINNKLNKVEKFLKDVQHKHFSRASIKNFLAFGESVFYLYELNGKPNLIYLDNEFIKFEGTLNSDWIVSFDLNYFKNQFNVKHNSSDYNIDIYSILRTFPTEFTKAYRIYEKNPTIRNQWFILDQKKTLAIKRGFGNSTHGQSLIFPVIKDVLFSQEYLDGLRNDLQNYISQVIYLVQPEGEKKGTCALNKIQQEAQFENFKNAILKNGSFDKTISTFVLAPNTKVDKLNFSADLLKNPIRKEINENLSIGLAFGMGLLGGESKDNFASQKLNMTLVLSEIYTALEGLSFQYEKVINNYYKFKDGEKILFEYLKISEIDSKDKISEAKDLYLSSGGSRTYWYAMSTGNSNLYLNLIKHEQAMGLDELCAPHTTSYTLSKGDKGGRPPIDDEELSKSGIIAKTNGQNENT